MPRYDFSCQSCEQIFELDLKLSERNDKSFKKICKKCESANTKQITSFNGGISGNGLSKSIDSPPCASGGGRRGPKSSCQGSGGCEI